MQAYKHTIEVFDANDNRTEESYCMSDKDALKCLRMIFKENETKNEVKKWYSHNKKTRSPT